MEMAKSIEGFLAKHPNYQKELNLLRSTLLECGFQEDLKWGMPAYLHKGQNLIGIGAFKAYVGLWFHQGVFLKDHAGVLHNAQAGKTKGMRQWRFHSLEEIDVDLIRAYAFESIDNCEAGKKVVVERNKHFDIPKELSDALTENAELAKAYGSLTWGKQKEYALYVSGAKQEITREKRIVKIVPMIMSGLGLNDKYRK